MVSKPRVIVCWECRRIGVYSAKQYEELCRRHGDGHSALVEIAKKVCPLAHKGPTELSERCRAHYYLPPMN